jgi:hypothetical protein
MNHLTAVLNKLNAYLLEEGHLQFLFTHDPDSPQHLNFSFTAPTRPSDWVIGSCTHGYLKCDLHAPLFDSEEKALTWVLKNLKQYVISKARYTANPSYGKLLADGKSCWSKSTEWKLEIIGG